MAFCSNCGKEIPDGSKSCPSCGAKIAASSKKVVTEWDHTGEFDAKDISENKVYALSAYLFTLVGVFLCNLLAKESPYARFHAREALKIHVTSIVIYILMIVFCWTCIVPVAGVIFLIILAVVKIIAFIQVCCGQAKEPWLVRSIGALH